MKQELVFTAPRRALPPRHLADLDADGRAAAVAELGLPTFRAKQLAQQYYGRLLADPQQMTDLPAAVRENGRRRAVPHALTPRPARSTATPGKRERRCGAPTMARRSSRC